MSQLEADKIEVNLSVVVNAIIQADRKRILNELMAIDKAADSYFNFSMAVKAWICEEFKKELKELKDNV